MRLVILILVSLSFLPVSSQTPLDYHILDYGRPGLFTMQATQVVSSRWHKQWQLSTFSGVQTSYGFLNRGSVGILSAPVGLQLTRRLNTNWYAFAGVSAGPEFLRFNSSWKDPAFNKTDPGSMLFNTNRFGTYAGAEAGFLYINDEKTFSISGSIHVDRSSYPVYPSYSTGMNAAQPLIR